MTNQPKEDRLLVPAGEIRVHRCYNPEHVGAYMLACPDCIAEWTSAPSSASAPQRPPVFECGICNDTKRVEYPDWADDAGQWTILNGPCPECYNFDASTAPSQLRMENAALRQQVETLTAERDEFRDQLYVEDGFGGTWGPCPDCGSRMAVVRPGRATCSNCETRRVCHQLMAEKREREQAIAQAAADERERWITLGTPLYHAAGQAMPELPHKGSCGPEAGCDASCMEVAHLSESLRLWAAAIRAGKAAKGDIK